VPRPAEETVCLSYVHDTDSSHSFTDSLVNLLLYDATGDGRIMRGGYLPIRCARSSTLSEARNLAAEGFLTRDADWLFIVDTDMGFAPDTVERLLEVADPVERPIVGGLCFAQKEIGVDGLSGFHTSPRVTILDWVKTPDGEKFAGRASYPVNSVVRCAGTGSACILIHRSVFEKIAAEVGPTWYNRITGTDGKPIGEDVSFCLRAGAVGIPVHVHTGVKTSHLKHLWLQEADFWRAAPVPAAAEEVAVIVPVTGRPESAVPFMQSLRASTGLACVYAVCDAHDDDTWKAWQDAGADHVLQVVYAPDDGEPVVVCADDGVGAIRRRIGSFAEKVNDAAKDVTEPWLFLVGDDVRFHPGWLDHAQHVASTYGADVIGTNDLGTKRVTDGEHATHVLVRREYVEEVGASWDGPGVVCHEGYRHWYVDDEIVTAAKLRGVWQMALGSVVEHLHPLFGKGAEDDVYRLGQQHAADDGKRFEERFRRYADA